MIQRTLVIVVAFLLPILAPAQECTEHIIDDNFNGATCVYAVDMDNDGDIDVLGAGDNAHDIAWWENVDGDGLNWAEHLVDEEYVVARHVFAADVDGDGDMDVLGAAAVYDDEITWWENLDGDGLNWAEHIVDDEFDNAYCVYATDVDGDGDIDVLGAAKDANDITWWENVDGTGLNWTEHMVDGEFDGANSVFATDVDGDGDTDVLGATFVADDITWWENLDGSGLSWSEHTVSGQFAGANCVYAADMDGDGDTDVLGAAFYADDISWWENVDGTGLNWIQHAVDGYFAGAYCVYATDMDGDGDTDILGAARYDNDITVWENVDGDGANWDEYTVDWEFGGPRSVYAADVDGDGDKDVLGAAWGADDITWWENSLNLGVDEESIPELPNEYALSSIYPNPFNPATTISVSLPSPSELDLVVFDVVGRQVATLAEGHLNAGAHTFTFDASNLASGMYFVRATVPGYMNMIQKVMLVR